MIDVVATAKCGLLDNMFLATFWFPMMPTVVSVTAFAVAHGLGRAASHAFGSCPIQMPELLQTARWLLAAFAALLVVMVALRGLVFPMFLARIVKDAYYCAYFEIGRDLRTVHWIVLV